MQIYENNDKNERRSTPSLAPTTLTFAIQFDIFKCLESAETWPGNNIVIIIFMVRILLNCLVSEK